MSNDQRRSARMKTFLKGRIYFNNGSSSMDCLVRDLSSAGARVELSETATLPEVFDLYINHKDATYRSTLRWRRGGCIGVTFEEPSQKAAEEAVASAKPTVPSASESASSGASLSILVRRIAELEAENAALRSAVASLGRATVGTAA